MVFKGCYSFLSVACLTNYFEWGFRSCGSAARTFQWSIVWRPTNSLLVPYVRLVVDLLSRKPQSNLFLSHATWPLKHNKRRCPRNSYRPCLTFYISYWLYCLSKVLTFYIISAVNTGCRTCWQGVNRSVVMEQIFLLSLWVVKLL